jgi:hypothetical protein
MNQEKFINTYIELLNGTLTESINKNLVLHAQKKVAELDLFELKNNFEEIEKRYSNQLREKQGEVDSLRYELGEMRKQRDVFTSEASELKKNVNHIETFKNELIKERTEKEKLLEENHKKQLLIEKLTTENAKLLKPEVETKKIGVKKTPQTKAEETTKDAGKF